MSTEDHDACANKVIAGMVGGAAGAAIVPAHVNWAIFASAMGAGVVGIGRCYGVQLTKDDAWHLVKQFFYAAGFAFMGVMVGSKILAAILSSTGIGHVGAVVLDGAISSAIAYAIGESAKAYFKGVRDKVELGRVFREAFKKRKEESA